MKKALQIALFLTATAALACGEGPTGIAEETGTYFKKGGKPGGGDPPPPSIGDPVILFSSSFDAKVGGGGCTKGNLSWSIYRMDIDGTFERVFPDAVELYRSSLQPSFSSDGQSFVFGGGGFTLAKGKCTDQYRQIATANVDGSAFHPVRETTLAVQLDQPRWSPGPVGGAERLGWIERTDLASSVIIANVDGSQATAVVEGTRNARVESFEWSASGGAIAVYFLDEITYDESYLRLYALECAASCLAPSFVEVGDLAPIPANQPLGDMDWARQHDWIAAPVASGVWKIDLTTPATPTVTQITAAGLSEGEVSWSPDDTKLLFTVWPGGTSRTVVELDLTTATLPWSGNLSSQGVRVVADVGNSWGLDWRR